ncbi:MAG: bifunctional UDP-N-acetylmuramoyl-tripeptide:D-alanyl-D-alanine ligase/alanine racemase [Bacteroidales bacterium]|jgi:alanine racemase|nr:bifunctional UDP-N-acetylmuramoyl-tripeptide:D-alanyl-D-alanine ligase/alanine racemase [Bacteroidales bacterium]
MKIKHLLFDSRRFNEAEGTAFFAITTSNNDGKKFINELYNKGVRYFVLQKPFDTTPYPLAEFIFVSDTVKALQDIAKNKRNTLKHIQVAAITGSNGKTCVKDWAVQLIGNDKKLCYTPKSYNSQIGVPVSVWQMDKINDFCIFEVGISQSGEMQQLEEIVKPNIGVLTNITDAHQANFSSYETKLKEKLLLFTHCKLLILCKENFDVQFIKLYLPNVDIVAWSWQDKLSKQIINTLPYSDRASQENAINAFMLSKAAGVNEKKLFIRLKHLHKLEQRLEVKSAINNSILIDDTYSSNLISLEIALDFLNSYNIASNNNSFQTKRIAILSEMEQVGLPPEKIIKKINTFLINKKIDKFYAIGESFSLHKNLLSVNSEVFNNVTECISKLNTATLHNSIILIKGSRTMALERISLFLEEKTHETKLEVNLSALIDNVRYFRSLLQPQTKMMSMVKASSYGCGGWEVALALTKSQSVDYFAVAYADEGVELRNKGLTQPIMVMNPQPESLERLIQYKLEPEIYSIELLKLLIQTTKCPVNIHIKLDTGMHRLGLEHKDLKEAIKLLHSSPNIKVSSVFSHLFGADNPNLDKYTLKQISLFESNSQLILDAFDYKPLRHLANSAAIVRFPQAHYDMVRIGIGMYGIGWNDDSVKQTPVLRRVHRLRTTLNQIHTVKAGESVSYNRSFIAKKDSLIGVIPIGYADGLNRHLGNGNYSVWINNKPCPIVGNICMDMSMIDITNIENVSINQEVIIFDAEYPVEIMSEVLGTISYEVFTSISQRVKRIYYYE